MNRNDTALHLLTAAHSALAQAGIRHAVVHGLEGAPGAFGRDVDILIDGKREAEAIRLLGYSDRWEKGGGSNPSS
jgi:hypothetical protein